MERDHGVGLGALERGIIGQKNVINRKETTFGKRRVK